MQKSLMLLLLSAALPAQAQPRAEFDGLLDRLVPELHTMVAQAGGAIGELSREVQLLVGDTDSLFAGREMAGSRVVRGAPYCADAVNETVQTLADSNRIVKKSTTRWCRDGEGRTRQEIERGDRGERKVVYLRDPVAGKSWSLDLQNKNAVQISSSRFGLDGVDSSAWREYAERMREWAKGLSERIKSGVADKTGSAKATADPVVITESSSEVITSDGKGAPRKEVYVIRMNSEGMPALPPLPAPPVPPVPPVPPAPPAAPAPPAGAMPVPPAAPLVPLPPMNVRMFMPRGQGVQTSLGSKEFDGVKANGEKTTWTIEAGKFGNEKPIVITSEKWTSPDLMLTVYARDFDPRSGETIYKLTNLKRGEPDAALFKVPGDFKVRESKSFGWHMQKPPAAPQAPAEKG